MRVFWNHGNKNIIKTIDRGGGITGSNHQNQGQHIDSVLY
jgi:hypothetical protein